MVRLYDEMVVVFLHMQALDNRYVVLLPVIGCDLAGFLFSTLSSLTTHYTADIPHYIELIIIQLALKHYIVHQRTLDFLKI